MGVEAPPGGVCMLKGNYVNQWFTIKQVSLHFTSQSSSQVRGTGLKQTFDGLHTFLKSSWKLPIFDRPVIEKAALDLLPTMFEPRRDGSV